MKGAGSESQKRWVIRQRTITPADIVLARAVAAEFFAQGRSRIAVELCRRWQWRSRAGRWKMRAAFAILLELEQRGEVRLPPARTVRGTVKPVEPSAGGAEPVSAPSVEATVQELRPLRWELLEGRAQHRFWRALLERHHYLGAPSLVGASLKYLVYSAADQLLGALGWQSAVAHLGCRDRLLGWNAPQRAAFLEHGVNNVRFLLLPWVRVRHLASALLSQGVRVLQRDWQRHYGVAVWWVESFVDPERFRGASYRAANWLPIGSTRGFAKRQGRFHYHGQPKEVYLYVLNPCLRRVVQGQASQPLLTREFVLAQRLVETNRDLAKRTRMSQTKASWKPKLPPELDLSPEDLACVGQELSEFAALFRPTFGRLEPFELYELYLRGLLSRTERKNVEAMALELWGPEVVRNLQRLMSDHQWDEEWLRRQHWEVCARTLADAQGVWSIDASEIPKKGTESVGVAPQYCGALGKTANCQSGVFVCYASSKGHALLDSRLYLPQCWFQEDYAERRQKCHIPESVQFATKPQLALELFGPLWESGLFPAQWIAVDASFGNNEPFLEQLPKSLYYLAQIACTRKVWVKSAPGHPEWEQQGGTVEQLLEQPGLLSWQSRKVAEGEKGPIVAAFARLRVYVSAQRTPESERWLLLRNEADGKIKYALSNAPENTPLGELIRISAARWPIERCFEEDKSELGFDHYEHRSWPAWHRHMRLVFLAQLFLLRLRFKYKKSPGADLAPSPGAAGMGAASSEAGPGLPSDIP